MPKIAEKPIKTYKLKTDSARTWEEKNWQGDHLTILKNDTSDLQLMFNERGDTSDIFDIPRVVFGGTSVTIEFGEEEGKRVKFNKIFIKHSAVTGGEIIFVVGGAASFYQVTAGAGGGVGTPFHAQAATAGDNEILAPSDETKTLVIKMLIMFNAGTASRTIYACDGEGGSERMGKGLYAPSTALPINFHHCDWQLAKGHSLYVNLDAAGTVEVSGMYDEI